MFIVSHKVHLAPIHIWSVHWKPRVPQTSKTNLSVKWYFKLIQLSSLKLRVLSIEKTFYHKSRWAVIPTWYLGTPVRERMAWCSTCHAYIRLLLLPQLLSDPSLPTNNLGLKKLEHRLSCLKIFQKGKEEWIQSKNIYVCIKFSKYIYIYNFPSKAAS